MSELVHQLDRLHGQVVAKSLLRRFTWFVRVLLALGFLPSGFMKVIDQPFTKLDPSTSPIGLLFDTLHRSGFLYEFIGWCQLAAAVLLLVPRTALLGAMTYLPLIVGIEVITTTMNFRGTWVITSLMLRGTVYLLCWDWPRLRPILGFVQPYEPGERKGSESDAAPSTADLRR